MRSLVAFGLGIAVGMSGLLVVQHPRIIEVIGPALGVTRSPPQIRSDNRSPGAEWCKAHPQLPCK